MIQDVAEKLEIKNFKEGQLETINAALQGKDVLCFMPTGYGKSVCFQIAAMMGAGVTIVVSPLTALMNDQVKSLSEKGVPSLAIHMDSDRGHVKEMLSKSSTKIIYVSPERLSNNAFVDFISKRNIERIVVDEAHCISMWGYGFRPDYQSIICFKRKLESAQNKRVPVSAFTATANFKVIADIIKFTGVDRDNAFFHKGNIIRENIHIEMKECQDKSDSLLNYLHKNAFEPSVIYGVTIKEVEKISLLLTKSGIVHEKYHSNMSPKDKEQAMDRFMNNHVDVMIATGAFGMGVNKKNIRHIIHYNIPESVEMFYQQIGRAGRDNKDSFSLLLYNKKDKSLNRFMSLLSYPKYSHVFAVLNLIKSINCDGIVDVDEDIFLKTLPLRVSSAELRGVINYLKSKKILSEFPEKNSPFLRVEIVSDFVCLSKSEIDASRKRVMCDFDDMYLLASSAHCRSHLLSKYFSSRSIAYSECGHCDNCLKRSMGKVILEEKLLNDIYSDIKGIDLICSSELIDGLIGVGQNEKLARSKNMLSEASFKFVTLLVNNLINLGFLISYYDFYIVNKMAFKNSTLKGTLLTSTNQMLTCQHIENTPEYQEAVRTRNKRADELSIHPDMIATHKQIVESITKGYGSVSKEVIEI